MINILRSLVFNFLYIIGSLVVSIILLPATVLPTPLCARIVGTIYGGYIAFVARHVMGLTLRLEGLENLPTDTPYIIAAKHQSAFETLQIPFMQRLNFPVIIHKKELKYLPIWGLYLGAMGQIGINRGRGIEALNTMSRGCKTALDSGRNIIIFPQGTRVAPGDKKPYKPGLAKLYKDLHVPIVPMALNSGVFWGKNSFFKKPGTIIFKFMPPIPAGLPPLRVMEDVERVIETESDALITPAVEAPTPGGL